MHHSGLLHSVLVKPWGKQPTCTDSMREFEILIPRQTVIDADCPLLPADVLVIHPAVCLCTLARLGSSREM